MRTVASLPLQVVAAVGFQGLELEVPLTIEKAVGDIIRQCLNSDPTKRPAFSSLVQVLRPIVKALDQEKSSEGPRDRLQRSSLSFPSTCSTSDR